MEGPALPDIPSARQWCCRLGLTTSPSPKRTPNVPMDQTSAPLRGYEQVLCIVPLLAVKLPTPTGGRQLSLFRCLSQEPRARQPGSRLQAPRVARAGTGARAIQVHTRSNHMKGEKKNKKRALAGAKRLAFLAAFLLHLVPPLLVECHDGRDRRAPVIGPAPQQQNERGKEEEQHKAMGSRLQGGWMRVAPGPSFPVRPTRSW